MAVVQNTLIGRGRGSVGNVTFTTWKGKNVIKGKAVNAYTDPTAGQIKNNNRFGLLVAFSRFLKAFYKAGFATVATTMSEYNKFIQLNNPEIFDTDSDPNSLVILPSKMTIAQGAGAAFTAPPVANTDGTTIEINANQSPNDHSTDGSQVFLMCFNGDTTTLRGSGVVAGEIDSAGVFYADIVIAGSAVGDVLQLFIVDLVTGAVSDSISTVLVSA